MKNFSNRWILITGGARGLGKALAWEFARRGARLLLVDKDEETLAETVGELEENKTTALALVGDLAREEEVRKVAEKALREADSIDVLVNNAGYAFVSEALDTEWEDWEKMLAVNLKAPILLTHLLLPTMTEKGEGHIVNIASLAGLVGTPGLAPYSVTKFGLVGYSHSLRAELMRWGVGMTAVCPGFIRTSIMEDMKVKGFDADKIRVFPSWITISPEKGARQIVKAIQKNKPQVVLTLFARLTYAFSRHFPTLFHWLAPRFYGKERERRGGFQK